LEEGVTPPPPLVCSVCNSQRAPNYFRVLKISLATGAEEPLTTVCSLPCLMRWLYTFGALQGARLAYGAKTAWGQLVELLKRR
jgi:hypothetical protein